ncbi:ATP/GTP-binding protein [Nocardia sp. SYP-A9097]|uniref:AAA family ATPase n=1 Tax=Nocardia sp. SYP-A9097 TaxID=2663237 RepID=UPI001891B932|nr:ATP-binding protein [Nocardia sp. SYP-A9097]
MLLRFRVENHASLRDEQELTLVSSECHPKRAEAEVPGSSELVTVPVAAIYGPNASGKSNVIDAITWMRWAVLSSYRRWDPTGGVPRRPFQFRRNPEDHPTDFQIDFAVDGVRHAFGFSVDDTRVRNEWMVYYPEGRARRLYDRDDKDEVTFGRWLTGRRKTVADSLRSNSLFLSVAAAQGHEQLSRIFRWFQFGLVVADDSDYSGRLEHTLHLLLEDDVHRPESRAVAMLLSYADLGATGLEAKEFDETDDEELRRVRQALRDAVGSRLVVEPGRFKDVRVRHRTTDGEFTLPLSHESSGTRTWIGLLGVVVSALMRGAVLCVDELDARLHPQLVDALIGMFASAEVNTRGAQLVFSSHDMTLLGRNAQTELSRDQIWFTEKDPGTLATNLFPMTDFPVRDTDNFEHRYLLGRFGAVPYLDDDFLPRLVELLEREDVNEGEEAAPADGEVETAGATSLPHLL